MKNKIMRGVKILANSLLYYAIFILAGSNCLGTQKKITTIQLTPKEENLIITDEDNEVLGQPNAEEICAVPEQQPNMPKAALEGSNKIKQKVFPIENGDPRSINRLSQLNQGVNSQSQIILGAPNKNTHDGNKVIHPNPQVNNNRLENVQDKDNITLVLNEKLSDLKTPMHLSKNVTKYDASLNQNQSLLDPLKEFKIEIDRLNKQKEDLKGRSTMLYKKNKYKKLLVKADKFFSYIKEEINDPDFIDKLLQQSEEDQKEYMKYTLDLANDHIEQLTER